MYRFLAAALVMVAMVLGGLVLFSPIDPASWEPPEQQAPLVCNAEGADRRAGLAVLTDALPGTPDGLAWDARGALIATAGEAIVSVAPDTGNVDILADAAGRHLTGLSISPTGMTVFATDERNGAFLAVRPGVSGPGAIEVYDELDGTALRWANDTAWTESGPVFTTSSSRRDLTHFFHELLEHRPSGRLIALDTETGTLREINGALHMANGVALAPDGQLLVAESSTYRVLSVDPVTGRAEPVIENLPGFPGNIRASDRPGVYWLTLLSPRSDLIDELAEAPLRRRLLAWLPSGLRPGPTALPCLVELTINETGVQARTVWLEVPEPEGAPTISTALEHDGVIYLSPAGLGGRDDRRILTVPAYADAG